MISVDFLDRGYPKNCKSQFLSEDFIFSRSSCFTYLEGNNGRIKTSEEKKKIKTFGIGRSGRSEGFVSYKTKELLTRARHTSWNVSHLSKQSDFSSTFDLRRTTKTGSKFSVRKARVVRERRKGLSREDQPKLLRRWNAAPKSLRIIRKKKRKKC